MTCATPGSSASRRSCSPSCGWGSTTTSPSGLSGAKAALPIWTQFMKAALAGRASVPFDVPEGLAFTNIDAETGKIATPYCPKVINEAFIAGTEPNQICDVHRQPTHYRPSDAAQHGVEHEARNHEGRPFVLRVSCLRGNQGATP
jgi:membrane carboxypeptidase/penicillin-binding protein